MNKLFGATYQSSSGLTIFPIKDAAETLLVIYTLTQFQVLSCVSYMFTKTRASIYNCIQNNECPV